MLDHFPYGHYGQATGHCRSSARHTTITLLVRILFDVDIKHRLKVSDMSVEILRASNHTHMLDVPVVRPVIRSRRVKSALVKEDSCPRLGIHFDCYRHQLGVVAERRWQRHLRVVTAWDDRQLALQPRSTCRATRLDYSVPKQTPTMRVAALVEGHTAPGSLKSVITKPMRS